MFKDGLRDLGYVQLVDLVAPAFNPKRSCHWQQAGNGFTMPKRKQWVRGSITKPVAKPAPVAGAKKATPTKVANPSKPANVEAAPVAPAKPAVPARPKPVGKVAHAVTSAPKAAAPKAKAKPFNFKVDEATGRPILPVGYKPKADEEYMNPLQLEYFRQKLITRREELVEESKQTIENLKDEVRDIGDEAERASRETENALELRTRDRYRKLINKIESIIKRVDEGDYGYCVDTGDEIGLDRLEARPQAERTIDAQERWEIRQKQQGD